MPFYQRKIFMSMPTGMAGGVTLSICHVIRFHLRKGVDGSMFQCVQISILIIRSVG